MPRTEFRKQVTKVLEKLPLEVQTFVKDNVTIIQNKNDIAYIFVKQTFDNLLTGNNSTNDFEMELYHKVISLIHKESLKEGKALQKEVKGQAVIQDDKVTVYINCSLKDSFEYTVAQEIAYIWWILKHRKDNLSKRLYKYYNKYEADTLTKKDHVEIKKLKKDYSTITKIYNVEKKNYPTILDELLEAEITMLLVYWSYKVDEDLFFSYSEDLLDKIVENQLRDRKAKKKKK